MPVISKDQCKAIDADVRAALASVMEKHGLEMTKTSSAYGMSYGFKFDAVPQAEDGATYNPNSPEAQTYEILAESYGLPADGLGKTVRMMGKTFTIIGLNHRAPKFPVLARCEEDGRNYKLSAPSVVRNLGLAKLPS
jgi:hypothetical protein